MQLRFVSQSHYLNPLILNKRPKLLRSSHKLRGGRTKIELNKILYHHSAILCSLHFLLLAEQ